MDFRIMDVILIPFILTRFNFENTAKFGKGKFVLRVYNREHSL